MKTVLDSDILKAQLRASAASAFLIESDLTIEQHAAHVALLEALRLLSLRICEIEAATRYEGVKH
jgi:hypothetical protein